MGNAQSIVNGATSGFLVLSPLRKLPEHVLWTSASAPASRFLPYALFEFLSWLPSKNEQWLGSINQINSFVPNLFVVMVCHCSNRNLTKTRPIINRMIKMVKLLNIYGVKMLSWPQLTVFSFHSLKFWLKTAAHTDTISQTLRPQQQQSQSTASK